MLSNYGIKCRCGGLYLITRRSLVQIQPPQPIYHTRVLLFFVIYTINIFTKILFPDKYLLNWFLDLRLDSFPILYAFGQNHKPAEASGNFAILPDNDMIYLIQYNWYLHV